MSLHLSKILGGLVVAAAGVIGLPSQAADYTTYYEMSPTGANDWSCQPSMAHPLPVVLVHGTFANMSANWSSLSQKLKTEGYCVYALNYGATAFTLATFNQVYGMGPVAESAQQVAVFVDRVLAATGATKVDIVGHSQGGMMPRHFLKFLGGATKVNALVGIAPDNHGSTVNGIDQLANAFPLVTENVVHTACPACTDQIAGSDFITNLNAGGDTLPGIQYTVIASTNDYVATPYTSQFLVGPNVTNITLQNQCANYYLDHVSMAYDTLVARNVLNALDPAHAVTPSCYSY